MKMVLPVSLVAALIAAVAGVAPAQAQTALASPPALINNVAPPESTPAMQRQKLEQTVALRAEITRLLAADGGTLTRAHLEYVRGRAEYIRNCRDTPQIGSLIAQRCDAGPRSWTGF